MRFRTIIGQVANWLAVLILFIAVTGSPSLFAFRGTDYGQGYALIALFVRGSQAIGIAVVSLIIGRLALAEWRKSILLACTVLLLAVVAQFSILVGYGYYYNS